MNLEDVKNVGEVVYPFIEPFYKTLITPQIEKLKKLVKKHSTSDQLIDNFFESKFLSYLERKAEEFNNVNVLAFQNEQILLKQIYYPLNIVSTSDNTQFRIELDTYDIIKKFRRLLINDGAGMGKSTIMKWIALNILETKSSIPVLINLRDLNSEHLILDEIFQQLEGLDDEISRDLFTAFLKLGNFTILMDGFDEIADNNAEIIVKDIKKLIALVPKNNFVLTSRPESSLSSFGEFQSFSIKELEIKEAYELIRKYDSLNQQKSIQEDLIQDIKLNLGQVKEFLINPFLTSILYRTYRFNKDIPTKKCGFYEEVISALYKTHDLSKNKFKREFQTTLDIQDIKQVLREVAKNTHKSGTIYNEQTFLQIIETSKKACPNLTFNNSAFLSDIVNQVPLFVKEGFKIRWAHKSLQDYFLAEYIYSNVNKEKIMQGLYDNKKGNYFNIIDFLIEMEPVFFQKTILLSYIKDFLSHCNSTYKKSEKVKIESIRLRQAYTFHNIFYIGF